jgi:hypothetical protein
MERFSHGAAVARSAVRASIGPLGVDLGAVQNKIWPAPGRAVMRAPIEEVNMGMVFPRR